MINKKKVLIVGLGKIGLHYDLKKNQRIVKLSHASSFSTHNHFDLQGAVDTNILNLQLFKKKYRKKVFSNLKNALLSLQPEIIVVSTPPKTHLTVIKNIFKYSKPDLIFCEKPFSNNYNNALKIYKLSIKNNCKLLINYSRRYDIYLSKIKKFLKIDSKKKILCNIYYSNGFLNNGSHFLNLSEFLFGKLIKVKIFKKLKIMADYNINFYANFENADVNFISTQDLFTSNYFEIFSDKYFVHVNQNEVYYKQVVTDKVFSKLKTLSSLKKNLAKVNPNIINLKVVNQINNFINGKKCFVCTAEEALLTMKNLQFVISND